MKKLFIIPCLMYLSYAPTIQAQDAGTDPRERLTFGVKGGLNYSNVWDEKGQDFKADARFGLVGGIFFGIPIGKFIGVQPEVLISQKGFQAAGTLAGSSYFLTRTTTYLDIPLQLQIKPAQFLTLVLGPQYSYLLHEKNTYTFGATSLLQEQEFNNDNIRKNVLGFVAGGDIIVYHVVVSGRVGWDFQNNNGDGTSSTPRYKNKWVQLTLGFKI